MCVDMHTYENIRKLLHANINIHVIYVKHTWKISTYICSIKGSARFFETIVGKYAMDKHDKHGAFE